MAYLLAITWFVIEAFLIPEGLLKWFYLSFYIHPLILVLCQIFLWVKRLFSWMRHALAALFGFISLVGTLLVTFFAGGLVKEPEDEVFLDAYDHTSSQELPEALFGSNDLNMFRAMVMVLSEVKAVEEESGVAVNRTVIWMDEEVDEDAASVCSSWLTLSPEKLADRKGIERDPFCENSALTTMAGLQHPALLCCSRLSPILSEAGDHDTTRIGQDPFFRKYTQTMEWFDLLNHERTCGISVMLQAESGETDLQISSIWGDSAKKRLIRSLESDLELVYVAQTCLSWEILCYQQKKVEDLLTNSTRQVSIQFDHTVAEELQKFQVLVQRFTEDELFLDRCRYREYVRARDSCKSLLQVPEIPGGRQVEGGEEEEQEEAVDLDEVMKAVEKCIRAFHGFVKADNKHKEEIISRSWWRLSLLLKSCLFLSWSSYPPVEDPRDLPLFSALQSILLKKSLRLRELQGKKKWVLRKMNNRKNKKASTRASQSRDRPQREEETMSSSLLLLFAEIDLELVARVLHMSIISSAHLTWCQAKLDNICFTHGKLSRAEIFPLFPY